MKKLSLEIETLRVASFATTAAAGVARAGTVRAHSNDMARGTDEQAPIPVTQQWTCTCPAQTTADPGAAWGAA